MTASCEMCGTAMWKNKSAKNVCRPCRRKIFNLDGLDPAEQDRVRSREYSRRYRAKKAQSVKRSCLVCRQTLTSRQKKYCAEHAASEQKRRQQERDRHRSNPKGHHRRAQKYGVQYIYIERRKICERDGWKCGLCGKPVDRRLSYPHPMSGSIDHIIPMSRGGDHLPENVQCAHLKCNMDKSNKDVAQQLALIG